MVDHIIPLVDCGPDEDWNTRNLCKPCDDYTTALQFDQKPKYERGPDGWPVDYEEPKVTVYPTIKTPATKGH